VTLPLSTVRMLTWPAIHRWVLSACRGAAAL
jgi:hypothetical protein